MNMIKKVFQDGFFIASSVFACVIVFKGTAFVLNAALRWDISSYPWWGEIILAFISFLLITSVSAFMCAFLIFWKHRSEQSGQEGKFLREFKELNKFRQENFILPNGKTSLKLYVILFAVACLMVYFFYIELANHRNEEIVFNGRSQPCVVKLDISQIESISKNGEVKIKVNFEKYKYLSRKAKSKPECKILD